MRCCELLGRSGILLAGVAVWSGAGPLCLGSSPVTLVSFQWASSASGSAGVTMACDPGCDPLSECNNVPVTSFSLGGTQMVEASFGPQIGRNCGGSCGGAGIASSYFQANGGAEINAPAVLPGYTRWEYSSSVAGQVGAGVGFGCGTASTSASVAGSHFCDIVFDIGPGNTVVTLSYQHFVSGEDATTESVWTIGNETTPFFSQTINAATGTVFQTGVVERVLPAGRYRLRLDGTLSENATAGGNSSQGFSSGAGAGFSIAFQSYVCAGFTTQPQPVSVCPSGTGQFSVLTDGTGPVGHRWQWQQTGAPGVWTDINDGSNSDSGGVVRFVGSGASSPTLHVTRELNPLGAIEVIQAIRCVAINACGEVPSDAVALTVCRGDINCDGAVNTSDLVLLLAAFGSPSPDGGGSDLDHNGVVNTADLTLLLSRFGQACG